MRQTSFTLDEILTLLIQKNKSYPSCMLINEVGLICEENKDEESERALLSFLDSVNPSFRMISFCYLYKIEEMRKKHHAVLAEFRTKPENQQYLQEIDEMLARS